MFLSMGTMMARQMLQHLSKSLGTFEGRSEMMAEIDAMPLEKKMELFESSKQEMINMSKNPPKSLPQGKLPVMTAQCRSSVCKWIAKKMEQDFSAILQLPFILLELGLV